MTPLLFLGIAVAGGIGSALRLFVDGSVRERLGRASPAGIVAVNVTGCLLFGVVTGLALGAVIADEWRLVLGTGLLGGYTTFSTASLDSVRLIRARRYGTGMLHAFGTLVASVVAAGTGLALATGVVSILGALG